MPCALGFYFSHSCFSNSLTAVVAHFIFELPKSVETFPILVRCLRLIARNDRELFSYNRGISHLNKACRIDDPSRGLVLGYEILTNN